jgi:hypothetical protein
VSFGRLGSLGRGFGRLGSLLGGASHPPSGSPYTLTAAKGSFILTGDAMAPLVDRKLPSDLGAFALTGIAATLTKTSTAGVLFKAASSNGNATTTRTFPGLNLGSGTGLIICAVWHGNGNPSSVVVNGVTLNPDVQAVNSNAIGMYSGTVTVTGSDTIVINGVGAFQEVGFAAYLGTGLSSNLVKHVGKIETGSNGAAVIDVTAGDFLIGGACGTSGSSFLSSTDTPPTAVRNVDTSGPFFTAAEWLPAATTSGTYSVHPTNGSTVATAAATYR